jgi:hypothetical protein
MASAGLQAVGDHRLFGLVPLRSISNLSNEVGRMNPRLFGKAN